MPDDILFCPSCNNKLRVPRELLGQSVQCPKCGVMFTAPTRSGSAEPEELATVLPADPEPDQDTDLSMESKADDPARERARKALLVPAIGLIIASFWGTMASFVYLGSAFSPDAIEQANADNRELAEQMQTQVFPITPGLLLGMGGFFFFVSAVVMLGAFMMLSLRMYPVAVTGSVLAMLNCSGVSCLLGLPLGIWALIVLAQPWARQAFD